MNLCNDKPRQILEQKRIIDRLIKIFIRENDIENQYRKINGNLCKQLIISESQDHALVGPRKNEKAFIDWKPFSILPRRETHYTFQLIFVHIVFSLIANSIITNFQYIE